MSANTQNQTPVETQVHTTHISKHTEPEEKSESDWSTGFYHGKNRGRNPRKSLHQLHHTQTLRGAETSQISLRAVKRPPEQSKHTERGYNRRPEQSLTDPSFTSRSCSEWPVSTQHSQSSQTTVRTQSQEQSKHREVTTDVQSNHWPIQASDPALNDEQSPLNTHSQDSESRVITKTISITGNKHELR